MIHSVGALGPRAEEITAHHGASALAGDSPFWKLYELDARILLLGVPYQKLSIEVEDACFIATDVTETEGDLAFRLNTDELVVAGPDHPIRAAGDHDSPGIYLHVRRGCEARLNRSTYEQLARIALERGDDWTVTSGAQSVA